MKNKIILVIAFYLLLIVGFCISCTSTIENKTYTVGFRYFQEYDTTRQYTYWDKTISRPMLIHFWYPSDKQSNIKPMNFNQYIDLISGREEFNKQIDQLSEDNFNFVNAYAQFAKNSYGIGPNITAREILESPVKASLNIPIANGDFPLIIYAPSNSKSPIQNHVICENLASHGFYVISIPSAGPNSINRRDLKNDILAQVEDMEFILDYFEKTINLKYSKIGLMGFSTGGLATSIFQMKHSDVGAVFSMDGSQDYSFFIHLSQLKDYDINKTDVPYFLAANGDSKSLYPYFNSVKSDDKIFVRMPNLSHFGFVSFWLFFDQCNPDSSEHNFTKSYRVICDNAFTFFDATLRDNKSSKTKLSDLSSMNDGYAIQETIDNSPLVELLNIILKENVDTAIATYKNNKSINKETLNYSEEGISNLAMTLIDYDLDTSIKLFSLNRDEYPDSWHVYHDLAFAYKLKGNIELAKETILKALEIDLDNEEALALQKKLEEIKN